MKKTVNIELECNSDSELYEKMQAMQVLIAHLTHDELVQVSSIIQDSPFILDEIRPLLNKEDMNILEMAGHARRIIGMLKANAKG